tara:strand:+ start:377 stop:1168 length:792 start_codon:yes stop_codon:yes gene_type:complete
MKKVIITIFIIGVGVAGLYTIFNKDEAPQETQVESSEENREFIVGTQSGTDEIVIDQVFMEEPGFVVIREVINDQPGQIIEVSDFLEAGIQRNVQVSLGDVQEINGTDNNGGLPLKTALIAVVYADDGDRGFNSTLDKVVYTNGEVLARYIDTGVAAPESSIVPNTQPGSANSVAVTITYTDEGFSPSTVEVSSGDTVRFVNKSSRPMWVASDNHPTHTILPTFDQFGTSAVGESYQYTFTQPGEWKYHDHVNASEVGVVIVR